MNWKSRRFSGTVSLTDKGSEVTLYGWVDTIRDHGQLLFIHIRDRSGVLQLVFDPEYNKQSYDIAQTLRSEDVIEAIGTVIERDDAAKNPHLPTGSIEIHIKSIKRLTKALTPPFIITEKELKDGEEKAEFNVDEDIRLQYRYLDLRRPSMQQHLFKRYRILKVIRDYLDKEGFIEVETPVLTKSTPEGARDYLVPSRTHEGHFYALPQSPQLFKQLLMVGGFERYFQVVKCFRDEDLRPNRQPEFTQLDMEASFIDETFIYNLIEPLITKAFEIGDIKLEGPFPHITYQESMDKYGCDRPDLRFGLEMINVTEIFKNTSYKIFQSISQSNGLIKGINIKGMADQMSKSMLQEDLAKKVIPSLGAKGMTWMKVLDGKLESNIVQFLSEDEQKNIIQQLDGQNGDVLIFIADTDHALVNDVLGRFRLYIANRLNIIPKNVYKACWVVDFPLYERKDGRLHSVHHPFTTPKVDITKITDQDELLKVTAIAYDIVVNGEELGGGSIRIHDPNIQSKIFKDLGLTPEQIEQKFGFFINAFKYGTPPHGGLAIGVDRLTSMVLGLENIREVIAFPKNRVAYCPMTQAPSPVTDDQLSDLHIRTQLTPKPESK